MFEEQLEEIKRHYSDREAFSEKRYSIFQPSTILVEQEKERQIIRLLLKNRLTDLNNLKLLEIGCGTGTNLISFIKLGFNPSKIVGNELLSDRFDKAVLKLPLEVKMFPGNALDLNFHGDSFDIVYQSMVFSSILNEEFKIALAKKMWQLTKPGGGILWYDFTYNNPKNQNVKGITFKELKKLFPDTKIAKWRLTLAPPITRVVTSIHPVLYNVFNFFPFLRTHILCWISKND